MDLQTARAVQPHRSITLAALVALSLGSSIVHAQAALRRGDDAHTTAAARATFLEGLACADREDWPCAVERFGRARAMRASPVILSNHAIALAHVGRVVEASETFRALARDPSAPAELRASAERGVTELAPRIGRITIELVGAAEGVSVSMDETEVDASLLGIAIPSDPGDHVIDARRDGSVVASARVHLVAAASERVELEVPADAPTRDVATLAPSAAVQGMPVDEPILDPTPPPRHEVYEEWWLWTLVGVAVVGAGVGIGVGVAVTSSPSLPAGSLGSIDGRL